MMTISIIITTKNRSPELLRTLNVLRSLDPQPLEVLITADGCTDDTVELVESEKRKGEIKNILLIVNEVGKGSVASRDRMMREATGDLLLTIDDDSYPEQMDCLETLRELFEKNPKMAIATFPQRTEEYPVTLTQTNFGEAHSVRSFPCSGACLRVSTYRSLQGFEPMFFHMYEEPDYAIQCVADGWDVLFTPEITVRHHWTGSGRSELRNHHFHARNELWSTVMRVPFPQMVFIIFWKIFSQAAYATGRGGEWLIKEPLWWLAAVQGLSRAFTHRHIVTWSGYKKWIALPDYNQHISHLIGASRGREADPRIVSVPEKITEPPKGLCNSQNIATGIRISIICPSYNRLSFIEECILGAMPIPASEFILVDDGSTDATLEFALTLQERYGKERIVVIPLGGNKGAQVARNRGMEQARGDMVLFCDSDDVLVPSGVEDLLETLTQNSDIDYAYGKVVKTDASLKPLEGLESIGSPFVDSPVEMAGYHWHTMGPLYRRSYLEKVGPWNLELTGSQDWEYQARVKLAKGRGLFVDRLIGYWRQHEGGRVGARKFRPDYVRSVVKGCDVILSGARTAGKYDRLLQRRVVKKLIIHAVESGANGDQSLKRLCLSHAATVTTPDSLYSVIIEVNKHLPLWIDRIIWGIIFRGNPK